MEAMAFIFVRSITVCIVTGDPCFDYKEIDDWTRSVANSHDSGCDGFLEPGWYRVTSKAGELMPTECVQFGGRCASMYNVWMNGSYPGEGQTVNVTACAANFDGDCCYRSYDIQVKNCSAYYVYNLVPVRGCPQRYCFGTELPCPEGQTSETGFTPGCYYEPCLETNYKNLSDWQRSLNYDKTYSICDSFIEPGWYRSTSLAGDMMPTTCPANGFKCGTTYPVWMNGTHPDVRETVNVTACASSHLEGCCFRNYDIQVRNCDGFYIYNLARTFGCHQGYCFGTKVPCPPGQISEDGFTPGCKYDPCLASNYKNITDWKRSVNYNSTHEICDSFMEPGWYRPTSLAGNLMPTTCPKNGFACGTIYPVWMNGTYPEVGEIKDVKACSSSHLQDCCFRSYDMQVKNCGEFHVYNLTSTFGCPQGYCFGTEVPCPQGQTSDNGFTPGCEFDPCQNYDVLENEDRRSSANVLDDNDRAIDDSRLTSGWYRFSGNVGNDMVNTSQQLMHCGTVYPVWMNGTIPILSEKTVDRICCLTGLVSNCESTVSIQVRNCGNFRVYNLKQLQKTSSAYCVGTLPIPTTTTTATTESKTTPHYVESTGKDKHPVHLIVLYAIIGLFCIALGVLLTLYYKRHARRRTRGSPAVSCVSLSSNPPPYDEIRDNKKNVVIAHIAAPPNSYEKLSFTHGLHQVDYSKKENEYDNIPTVN